MRRWRQSAAFRIALVYSAGFALAVLALGAVTFVAMHFAFRHQIDATLRDQAQVLSREYHIHGEAAMREAIAQREAIDTPTRLLYAVFTANGARVAGALDTRRPPAGFADIAVAGKGTGDRSARAYGLDLDGGLRLVVAADGSWIESIDVAIIAIFATTVIGVVVLGGAGALMFGAYLRRRLSAFALGADAIIAGDFAGRMPISPREDEFDDLAVRLNTMLERIERLLTSLRQVSSDVAHDLRTPLARVRQRLEAAQQAPMSEQAGGQVSAAIDQVDRVLALFAAILTIAEVEAGGRGLTLAPLDLGALAEDICESYEPAVRDGGRRLNWQVGPGITVLGQESLLAQAVTNLIDNAQQHTPPGTLITVALAHDARRARLTVTDDGPGVPAEHYARIIRRFERLEGSRSTPGFGLGLNLVDAIARRHGGTLAFGDARPGLVVSVTLPSAPANAAGPAGDPREVVSAAQSIR